MNHSGEIAELGKALCAAQLKMKAAIKASENPHFKSKFAGLPEVFEVARVLHEHGLAFIQPAEVQGDEVAVETMLLHASGQWVSTTLRLKPQQATPQGIGSAITYARRYSLCSLVGIVADEDDDGNAASARPSVKTVHAEKQNGGPDPVALEKRLMADCTAGWPNWADKKKWRDTHKDEKGTLSLEAQLRLSKAWAAAKPIGSVKDAPKAPSEALQTSPEADGEDFRRLDPQ